MCRCGAAFRAAPNAEWAIAHAHLLAPCRMSRVEESAAEAHGLHQHQRAYMAIAAVRGERDTSAQLDSPVRSGGWMRRCRYALAKRNHVNASILRVPASMRRIACVKPLAAGTPGIWTARTVTPITSTRRSGAYQCRGVAPWKAVSRIHASDDSS